MLRAARQLIFLYCDVEVHSLDYATAYCDVSIVPMAVRFNGENRLSIRMIKFLLFIFSTFTIMQHANGALAGPLEGLNV